MVKQGVYFRADRDIRNYISQLGLINEMNRSEAIRSIIVTHKEKIGLIKKNDINSK